MRRMIYLLIILVLLVIGVFLVGVYFVSRQVSNLIFPSPQASVMVSTPPSPVSSLVPTPLTTSSPTSSPAGINRVKLFFIALEDNGQSGKRIGCNDSVVGVDQAIPPTQTPLRAALERLLAVKTQTFGQSGLYNSLYQSNLRVERAVIQNGIATVNLAGTHTLGGVCDNPRFKAQIEETALQFDTVNRVEIFINGTPIDELLSGQ